MLGDDADAAGQLQVVDEEGDLHAAGSAGSAPSAPASALGQHVLGDPRERPVQFALELVDVGPPLLEPAVALGELLLLLDHAALGEGEVALPRPLPAALLEHVGLNGDRAALRARRDAGRTRRGSAMRPSAGRQPAPRRRSVAGLDSASSSTEPDSATWRSVVRCSGSRSSSSRSAPSPQLPR